MGVITFGEIEPFPEPELSTGSDITYGFKVAVSVSGRYALAVARKPDPTDINRLHPDVHGLLIEVQTGRVIRCPPLPTYELPNGTVTTPIGGWAVMPWAGDDFCLYVSYTSGAWATLRRDLYIFDSGSMSWGPRIETPSNFAIYSVIPATGQHLLLGVDESSAWSFGPTRAARVDIPSAASTVLATPVDDDLPETIAVGWHEGRWLFVGWGDSGGGTEIRPAGLAPTGSVHTYPAGLAPFTSISDVVQLSRSHLLVNSGADSVAIDIATGAVTPIAPPVVPGASQMIPLGVMADGVLLTAVATVDGSPPLGVSIQMFSSSDLGASWAPAGGLDEYLAFAGIRLEGGSPVTSPPGQQFEAKHGVFGSGLAARPVAPVDLATPIILKASIGLWFAAWRSVVASVIQTGGYLQGTRAAIRART